MADEREIAAYYDRGEEEGRLGDWGRLEFLRTRELRALRPGGLLAAAAITRFASTLDGVAQGFLLEPGFEAIVERDLTEGQLMALATAP
jgi:hypothetical protein